MPMKPPTICRCGRKVQSSAICPCKKHQRAERERVRPTASQRGYTSKWAKVAKEYLEQPANRFCRICGAPAKAVDHIQAHKGDARLFWNRNNWQPLCIPCNSRKAAKSEGGFGNEIKGSIKPCH